VLSISIYRRLSSLVSPIHVLLARVKAGATVDVVALRVLAAMKPGLVSISPAPGINEGTGRSS
jgi:hypothetical protein